MPPSAVAVAGDKTMNYYGPHQQRQALGLRRPKRSDGRGKRLSPLAKCSEFQVSKRVKLKKKELPRG